MQLHEMKAKALTEFRAIDSSQPSAFAALMTVFAKLKHQFEQRIKAVHLSLLLREQALLSPLLQRVEAAISAVQLELKLDTLLRTNDCPFDLWCWPTTFINAYDHLIRVGGSCASSYRFPPKDPCPRFRSILFVDKNVIDIGPLVAAKLQKQAQN